LENGGGEVGRKIVGIYFNDITEAPLLQYANKCGNFSAFVKNCIKEKMDPRQLISPEIERAIQEMIKKQITIYDAPRRDDGLRNDLEDYF
jgi:hypothetical protein